MKKLNKLNQKGLGIVEILLLILLLILLGLLGWYIWQKSQENDETSQPQANVVVSETTESSEDTVSYLEIPELGIKLELNDSISDAYYVMIDGYAYLSLTSLKDIGDCAAEETGVVAISKVSKTDTDEMLGMTYEEYINQGGNGVIIGDYVYLMNRSQAYCSEDPAIQAQQQAAWDGFLAQATKIQAL